MESFFKKKYFLVNARLGFLAAADSVSIISSFFVSVFRLSFWHEHNFFEGCPNKTVADAITARVRANILVSKHSDRITVSRHKWFV